ncbi:MAG: beta-lactamase family protein [Haliscomenobacter sp.]|nr:beta-lactamase family protein [Haliscomenobacter sp.]
MSLCIMKKGAYLILLLLAWSIGVLGQDAGFTGYATSLVEDGLASFNTYGFKDKDKTRKYDTLTVQPVGSVSKVVIGLALMKASELGFISLDGDINQYLNFEVLNPNIKNTQPITLRRLATHTSGIKDTEKFYVQAYAKGLTSPVSLEEFLKSYLTREGSRYSKKNFGKYPSGEKYSYSNIGAALAAYIIERASKMPFDVFTERYVFQPLGMQHTHWFYNENQMDAYAQLFDEKDNPLDFYALATYPDGALKTNIVDLTKLLQALMNGYQGKCAILTENSWKVFFAKNFSETTPIEGISPKEPNCGIFIAYTKSGAIGHTGSDPGVCAFMFFNPSTTRGKVFIANEDLTPQNLASFQKIWEGI